MPTQGKRTQQRKKKKKAHAGRRVLKYAYRTLVAISAIIVTFYVVHALLVREPTVDAPPTPTEPGTVTDNPDTPEDESQSTLPPEDVKERKDQCYTFLLAASDQSSGNTDTIIVVTYDVPNQKVGMVSVPRDTLIERTIGSRTYHKINAAYAYGGMEELQAAVSELLGIPIHFTIKVNINGFVELVDAVGGVDFEVPVHMSYDDPTQNLHIHYEPKMYYGLTGQQVLEIARCRSNSDGDPNVNGGVYPAYPDSDIGRTRTQQQLLIAIAKKMLSWNSLTRINEYINIFQENVQTNLELTEMIWFAEQVFYGMDLSTGVTTATLPGDGAVSYNGASVYELFPEEVLEIVNTMLNPYTEDLTLEDLTIFQK